MRGININISNPKMKDTLDISAPPPMPNTNPMPRGMALAQARREGGITRGTKPSRFINSTYNTY